MIKHCFSAFALLLLSLPVAAQPEGEWKPLFDGKSLDGWTQRGGKAKYQVENGEIVGVAVPKTPNSFLCTDRDYSDFELEFEVKVHPSLNSGVQIRSHSRPDYRDGRVHGIQVEIDPSERAWSGGLYEEGRRLWLADLKNNPAAGKAFRNGDWNKFRVRAQGPEYQTWVNEVPAATLHDELTSSGFIALQVHATTSTDALDVRWRNIRLRELPPPTTSTLPAEPPAGAVVLFDGTDFNAWQNPKGEDPSWKLLPAEKAAQAVVGAGNLISRRQFRDARIHVEFRTMNLPGKNGEVGSNSGVYIQDRYEIQIIDMSSSPTETAKNGNGSIYRQTAPSINVSKSPLEWQSYDIQFTAPRFGADAKKTANARVTVHHDGVLIHNNVEILEPTGAAKMKGDSPDPQPLVLQEHGYPVQFRNVWAVPVTGAGS